MFVAADATTDAPVEFRSRWFNLDGLGIVRVAASGPARYVPSPTSAAGRLEQRFHLNAIATASLAPQGSAALVAQSVLVFYPGQSAAATRAGALVARGRGGNGVAGCSWGRWL